MGQAGEKIQQKLHQMGHSKLPECYKLSENNVFRSQKTPKAVKGLSVLLNPNEVDAYLSHLNFRKQHKQLIQVLYVDIKKQQADYIKLIIYIEYIPLRLQETYSVYFNNIIKIIYHGLRGFKVLFQKFGYFTIDASLIGINQEGIPKCWLNKKYSEPKPKPSFSYIKVTKGQTSMVEELKEVFNCQVDKSTVPHKFNLQGTTFDTLINEIYQKFGEQFLMSKLDLNDQNQLSKQQMESSNSSSIKSVIEHKTSSGTQIRFNYQMKQSKKSNIKITFGNRSLQPTRSASTSQQNRQKAKINFNYQQNIHPEVMQPMQKSLIHELEETKADNINNRITIVNE